MVDLESYNSRRGEGGRKENVKMERQRVWDLKGRVKKGGSQKNHGGEGVKRKKLFKIMEKDY